MKVLSDLARFISKIKKAYISNFLSVKYFSKRFLFLKISNVRVNYCGNYGPPNLLLCFTGHNSEQLNSRQRQIAVNSLVHYSKLVSKRVSARSFKIFDPVTIKWWSFEVFVKLNGKDILLAFCAKCRKSKTCVFSPKCIISAKFFLSY